MSQESVRVWEETVVIPTYPVKPPDHNPMFLEKRVNQGTSGRTYPLPVISGIEDEKVDKPYKAVWLENDWIRVMVLPELGGRIQIGEDKTNGYPFFYKQSVVKPALIGLAGPWISGGVEFNWPQHHRPTTFCPMDYHIEEHADGSKTVWMGEIEPLYRMKGMVGITVHPHKSIVEARVQLFNGTPFPHPFMWWANVAVKINDDYQAFFPTDVHYVTDHARRAMSSFPIARNSYYGVDYSSGMDLTWTKNMHSAGSYFVMKSDYDFFGGYDHALDAGVVHVADRFIAPGKKMFNWGNWEAGHRWQRNLTDSDGEYVELMAGVYTDNQPDFSWMQPYETRQFSQFWYPIQKIGPATNANLQSAIHLSVADGKAKVGATTTEAQSGCTLTLRLGDQTLYEKQAALAPNSPLVDEITLPADARAEQLTLLLYNAAGKEVIRYTPPTPEEVVVPDAFKPAPWPAEIATNEELYLTGLHLEQYRHPTRDPEPYYEEALRRDPGDARCNNALGLLRLRRGQFAVAVPHFQKAIERLIRYNPNPYDGEPYYNLGIALKYLHKDEEAYKALYKAAWNQAWAASAYFTLAQIDCARADWQTCLAHLEKSLVYLSQNLAAANLKTAALRHAGRLEEALALANATQAFDPLGYGARFEKALIQVAMQKEEAAQNELSALQSLSRESDQAIIELSLGYAQAGLWHETQQALQLAVSAAQKAARPVYPIIYYLLAEVHERAGQTEQAEIYGNLAEQMPPDLCFPSRLEEMLALQSAMRRNPTGARAPYYLGNLLYDKQRYEEGLAAWEASAALASAFSTLQRNLALAYYNDGKDSARARQALEYAFQLDPSDARILYELVIMLEQGNVSAKERLTLLEAHPTTIRERDDLFLEYIQLLNAVGQYSKAADLIEQRIFHPWEGGEGAVTRSYVWSHLGLAMEWQKSGDSASAQAELEKATQQPESLGEGRGWGYPETNLFYFVGKGLQRTGQKEAAQTWFEKALNTHPWGASEFSFFQGIAALELGKKEEAEHIFNQMIESANQLINAKAQTPYFASSMPLFHMRDDDQQARNQKIGHWLLGLAYLGLGQKAKARAEMDQAMPLEKDPNFTMGVVEELIA